jgi:hypothetical protein
MPDDVRITQMYAEQGAMLVGLWKLGECPIIVSREPDSGSLRSWWHMSISHADRYPTWNEIGQARYKLLPSELTFGILLPPVEQYVNLHPNCFHLHEIDPCGMAT